MYDYLVVAKTTPFPAKVWETLPSCNSSQLTFFNSFNSNNFFANTAKRRSVRRSMTPRFSEIALKFSLVLIAIKFLLFMTRLRYAFRKHRIDKNRISILRFKSIAISDVNIWIFMDLQFSRISIVTANIGQNGKLKIKPII